MIGIGVIGMGWMGMAHSRAYRNVPDRFYDSGIRPRLIICADDVRERALHAQTIHGFEGVTTSWQQVIDHPEVQVVNVTSPNYLHLEMVRAATAASMSFAKSQWVVRRKRPLRSNFWRGKPG